MREDGAGGQREGMASRGRAQTRTKISKKGDAEKDEKRKSREVLRVGADWPPATPAAVPFSSPQAHSAGFA